MPLLPREGLTVEAVYGLFQHTLFNPLFTGLWLFAVLYLPQQVHYFLPTAIWKPASAPSFLFTLQLLFAYGAIRYGNNFLSSMVLNNWTKDPWRDGKEIVMVTGSSGGIGEAIVRGISKSSARVIAVDILPPKKPFPTNVHFYKVDLTNSSEIGALGKDVRKAHGDPTVLINNAGIATCRPILNQTDEHLQTNLQCQQPRSLPHGQGVCSSYDEGQPWSYRHSSEYECILSHCSECGLYLHQIQRPGFPPRSWSGTEAHLQRS